MNRIEGYGFRQIENRSGLDYTNASPWKLLLHTIEGSYESALSAYHNGVGNPHATVSLDRGIYTQHIDLDRAAYALRNARGGTETNRDNVIQVELEGNADDVPGWSLEKLTLLADRVIGPIVAAVPGIARVFAPVWAGVGGYGLAAAQRMSAAEWDAFSGVLGHQHAPENTHWDPGALDVRTLSTVLGWNDSEEIADLSDLIEKYRDNETGEEFVVWQKGLVVRRFSSPRGDGKEIGGLTYAVNDGVAEGEMTQV